MERSFLVNDRLQCQRYEWERSRLPERLCARHSQEHSAAGHEAEIGHLYLCTVREWCQDSRQDPPESLRRFRIFHHHSGYRSLRSARHNGCGSVDCFELVPADSGMLPIVLSDFPVRPTEIPSATARPSSPSVSEKPLVASFLTLPIRYRRSCRFSKTLHRTIETTWSSQRCN
jgi:hypothetical protein